MEVMRGPKRRDGWAGISVSVSVFSSFLFRPRLPAYQVPVCLLLLLLSTCALGFFFWNRALVISPALLLVRANLAEALLRAGRPEEARSVLLKALQFNPALQPARDLLNRLPK